MNEFAIYWLEEHQIKKHCFSKSPTILNLKCAKLFEKANHFYISLDPRLIDVKLHLCIKMFNKPKNHKNKVDIIHESEAQEIRSSDKH